MPDRSIHRARTAAAAVVLAAASVVSLAPAARAGASEACKPNGDDVSPFALDSRLLTGPGGGDLSVTLTTATPGCVVPSTLERLQVETDPLQGSDERRQRFTDVAAPAETNAGNNDGQASVEVTEFEADQSQVLVPSLAGYGAHFNHRVYAKISRDAGVTPENVLEMESKMVGLQPQFVRMFVNDADLKDPDRKNSFVRTMLLAQRAGATINVTWQGGTLDVKTGSIPRLAAVLNDLVQNQGVTGLRWLTLQNEPNGTRVTLKEYETRYRELDPFIFGIRGQVRYMGGDLVRNGGLPNADQQD